MSTEIEKAREQERARTMAVVSDEAWNLAKLFHENYERLAPIFGYKTREESAVPWGTVPVRNRQLMAATCYAVLLAYHASRMAERPQCSAAAVSPEPHDAVAARGGATKADNGEISAAERTTGEAQEGSNNATNHD